MDVTCRCLQKNTFWIELKRTLDSLILLIFKYIQVPRWSPKLSPDGNSEFTAQCGCPTSKLELSPDPCGLSQGLKRVGKILEDEQDLKCTPNG